MILLMYSLSSLKVFVNENGSFDNYLRVPNRCYVRYIHRFERFLKELLEFSVFPFYISLSVLI